MSFVHCYSKITAILAGHWTLTLFCLLLVPHFYDVKMEAYFNDIHKGIPLDLQLNEYSLHKP